MAQPASAPSSSYTYPLATSVQPVASVSTLPSYSSTSTLYPGKPTVFLSVRGGRAGYSAAKMSIILESSLPPSPFLVLSAS